MRVISGLYGGRALLVPKEGVRPTMDRVKAAIFSMLGVKVVGARVLDLFAGTGGLGIEALSRNADSVVFVDKEKTATECIRTNPTKLGCLQKAQIIQSGAGSFLGKNAQAFDLIFADPPYAKDPGDTDYDALLFADPGLVRALAPTGWFVLEKMPGKVLKYGAEWEEVTSRRYGATEVTILQFASGTPPPSLS